MTLFTLSPSSLVFDWAACRTCFWWRHHGEKPLRSAFPTVFNAMDKKMKEALVGKDASQFDMPAGTIVAGRRLSSSPIPVSPDVEVALRGITDIGIELVDGRVGVVDNKVSGYDPTGHLLKYGMQLGAYAWMLEHPAVGAPQEVGYLGLLVWSPETFVLVENIPGQTITGSAWTAGPLQKLDIAVPAAKLDLLGLVQEVGEYLAQPDPPAPGEKCGLCEIRSGRRLAVPV